MMNVYGSLISYYAGKLETYLRYRGIEYQMLPMMPHEREILAGAGAVQSPTVKLEDGRWLADTTPILAWFEAQRSGPTIYPKDPGMRFLALLLEDHADEWLWRSAMHYRWSYRLDRDHASGFLTDEMGQNMPLPRFLKRKITAYRQFHFVGNDGVTDATRAHVEAGVVAAYDGLEAVFAERPFILGDRPTIADFGFMAPMLRHFAQDPTPAELMRNRAPRVYAWVGRMWSLEPDQDHSPLITDVDVPLAALLREACETHLVQLRENARAFGAGASHFEMEVQGCRYVSLPVSRYRVWCLEELRREWQALDEATRETLRAHLRGDGAPVLWDSEVEAESGYDPERRVPFNRAINVYGKGVPGWRWG